MVNTFRDQMPLPIFGIGHSMGGNNLVNLSLMHPRLIHSLVLIDPVIQSRASSRGNFAPAQASSKRRDRWPSRKAAREAFARSKFYQRWDPHVLDLWIQHGLRELPTLLYPVSQSPENTGLLVPATVEPTVAPPPEKEVTLRTTKHQEVLSFVRPNFDASPSPLTHWDVDPAANPQQPFYRPEPIITFRNLPHLKPSVLYLFGSESEVSAPLFREEKMRVTGTGVGGSGGQKTGRVKEVLIMGAGHLIPMERVEETADLCVAWLGREYERWVREEQVQRARWEAVAKEEKAKMGKQYEERISGDLGMGPVGKGKGQAKL